MFFGLVSDWPGSNTKNHLYSLNLCSCIVRRLLFFLVVCLFFCIFGWFVFFVFFCSSDFFSFFFVFAFFVALRLLTRFFLLVFSCLSRNQLYGQKWLECRLPHTVYTRYSTNWFAGCDRTVICCGPPSILIGLGPGCLLGRADGYRIKTREITHPLCPRRLSKLVFSTTKERVKNTSSGGCVYGNISARCIFPKATIFDVVCLPPSFFLRKQKIGSWSSFVREGCVFLRVIISYDNYIRVVSLQGSGLLGGVRSRWDEGGHQAEPAGWCRYICVCVCWARKHPNTSDSVCEQWADVCGMIVIPTR